MGSNGSTLSQQYRTSRTQQTVSRSILPRFLFPHLLFNLCQAPTPTSRLHHASLRPCWSNVVHNRFHPLSQRAFNGSAAPSTSSARVPHILTLFNPPTALPSFALSRFYIQWFLTLSSLMNANVPYSVGSTTIVGSNVPTPSKSTLKLRVSRSMSVINLHRLAIGVCLTGVSA